LVVSLHWQEGAMKAELMTEMKAYLQRRLSGMGSGVDIVRGKSLRKDHSAYT
jgi:hypothetical protein